MICPRCRLINPDSALRCDCGYDFPSGTVKASYLDTAQLDILQNSGALDRASTGRFKLELERGARYVVFQYCISIAVVTLKRTSRAYLVKPDQNRFRLGLRYSLISFLFGWWGIPWGPIWTIGTIVTNCRGGVDITNDLLRAMVHAAT